MTRPFPLRCTRRNRAVARCVHAALHRPRPCAFEEAPRRGGSPLGRAVVAIVDAYLAASPADQAKLLDAASAATSHVWRAFVTLASALPPAAPKPPSLEKTEPARASEPNRRPR